MQHLNNQPYVGFTSSEEKTIWFDEESDNSIATTRTVPGISFHDPEAGTVTLALELLLPKEKYFRNNTIQSIQLDKVLEFLNSNIMTETKLSAPIIDMRKVIAHLPTDYIEEANNSLFGNPNNSKPKVVDLHPNAGAYHAEYPIFISKAITIKEDDTALEMDPVKEQIYGFIVEQFDQRKNDTSEPQPLIRSDRVDYISVSGRTPNLEKINDFHNLIGDRAQALAWAVNNDSNLRNLMEFAVSKPDNVPPICYNKVHLSQTEMVHILETANKATPKTENAIKQESPRRKPQPPKV